MAGSEIQKHIERLKSRDENMRQPAAPPSAEPKEMIVEEEAEKAVPPEPTLQVEDLPAKKRSGSRLPWHHRTTIAPFGIAELKIHPTKARPREAITISFKATNNSELHSIYPVTLRTNGKVVAGEVVSLPPRATLRMNFTVVETMPGDYEVEVNDLPGKFTIIGEDLGSKIRESEVLRAEMGNLEARFKLGLLEVGTYLKHKEALNEDVTPAPSRLQAIIDKVADYIEFGLDKIGDGMILPIRKLVDVSAAICKVRNWKAKR